MSLERTRRSIGQLDVRVGGDEAVPGKVLADCRHAAARKPRCKRRRQMRDRVRVAVKRAIADDRARAVIEVEHGREAEIDAVRGELALRTCARSASPRAPRRDVAVPHLAQRAHRRNRREAVAKALHAAAFVIDGDQQRAASRSA